MASFYHFFHCPCKILFLTANCPLY